MPWAVVLAFGVGWRLAGEVRAADGAGGLELHKLDAGEVGVEEVELNLAVARSHLRVFFGWGLRILNVMREHDDDVAQRVVPREK